MELVEIKNILENQSIQKRIDFMETYDFENDIDNKNYFINFIKNNPESKNDWYMMWLIDLAGLLEIKDINLLNKYLGYLVQSKYYLLKLTILDYITYTYNLYTTYDVDYSNIRLLLQSKYDRLIVKNGALLTLILLFPVEKEKFMLQLKKNLLRTNNYREHIRVLSFFLNRDADEIITHSYIKELIEVAKSKDFGQIVAVKSVILEVQKLLSND